MTRHLRPTLILCLLVLASGATAIATETVDPLLGPAPGTYKITSPDGVVKIPFVVHRGDIHMRARINGIGVGLMIDNGFLWDQLLLFGGPLVDSLNLTYDGETGVGGAGDGEEVPSTTASGITVSFDGIEFFDQPAIVTPASAGFDRMWAGAVGQISAAFFKHFVVGCDFDNGIITLTKPEDFEYQGNGTSVELTSPLPAAWAPPVTLELDDERVITMPIPMDLGLNDCLHIDVGGEHNITLPKNAIKTSLGFGVQGEIRGHTGRIRKLTLGGYEINNLVTGFIASESSDPTLGEGWIGLDLMSRFHWIFDYPGHRVIIEPGARFDEPTEYNMSGIGMRPGPRGSGYREVTAVAPESPAAEAGLQVGDQILTFNGRPALEYDIFELIPLLQQPGETLEIVYRREGEEKEANLILRRLL